MKKIRIGQIGIGHNHGSEKMRTLRHLSDYFEVVGVAETDPRWLKERGGMDVYQGLPVMSEEELFQIPGLEAVAVETDGPQLLPTALRCAERGLHLHMDKPGGEDLFVFEIEIRAAVIFKIVDDSGIILLFLKELGLLPPDLRFELVDCLVDASQNIFIACLSSVDLSVKLHGDLDYHLCALGSDAYIKGSFVTEILVELSHL